MPTYVDEDGNIVSPNDLSNYEIIPEKGYLESAWDFAKAIPLAVDESIRRPFSGAVTAAEDLLGTGTNYGQRIKDLVDAERLRNLEASDIQPGGYQEFALNAVSSALPLIGATLTGVGAPAVAGGFAAQAGFDKYADLKDRGASPYESAIGGGVSGLVGGVTSLLPFAPLSRASGLLGKTVGTGLGNLAQGAINRTTDLGVDAYSLGEVPTEEQIAGMYTKGALEDLISTGIAVPAVHYAPKLIRRAANKVNDSQVAQLQDLLMQEAQRSNASNLPPEPPSTPPPNVSGEQTVVPGANRARDFQMMTEGAQVPALQEAGLPAVIPKAEPPAPYYADYQPIEQGRLPPGETRALLPPPEPISPPNVSGEQTVTPGLNRSKDFQLVTEGAQVPAIQKSPLLREDVTTFPKPIREISAEAQARQFTNPEIMKGATEGFVKNPKIDLFKNIYEDRGLPKDALSMMSEDFATFQGKGRRKNIVDPETIPGAKGDAVDAEGMPLKSDGTDIFGLNQRGAASFSAKELYKGLSERFSREDLTPDEKSRLTIKELEPIEQFLGGRVYGKKLPFVSKALGEYRKQIIFPMTLAKKDAGAAKVVNLAFKRSETKEKLIFDMYDKLSPYLSLANKSKVNDALIAQRRLSQESNEKGLPRIEITPEILKSKGFSDADIAGYQSVRAGMDTGLEILREAWMASKPEAADSINKTIAKLREQDYVPFGRFGDHYVYSEDANHFSLHESKSAAKKQQNALLKAGHKVESGEMQAPALSAYEKLPLNIMSTSQQFSLQPLDTGLPPKGFTKHLTEAKLTGGESQNLERSIAEYALGLGNYASSKIFEGQIKRALSDIDPLKKPQLRDEMDNYIKDLDSNRDVGKSLRKLFSLNYLGFQLRSPIINTTQSISTTWPLLAKYSKNPTSAWTIAMGKAASYFKDSEKFTKNNPELAYALKQGIETGHVNINALRDLSGRAREGSKLSSGFDNVVDASLYFFDAAEKLNRVHAFIAGYQNAPKALTSENAKIDFAKGFVDETQFVYGKENRPKIARGALAPAFTFKMFGGNWLRLVRDNAGITNPVMWRLLTPLVALGGVSALPFVKDAEKLLEGLGIDSRRELRELVENPTISDSIISGIPAGTKLFNISTAVGMGEYLPSGKDTLGGLLGVPYDLFVKAPAKAYDLAVNHGEYQQALESLPISGAKGLSRAYRAATDGLTDKTGKPLLPDASAWEIAQLAGGFTPPRLLSGYEKLHSRKLLEEQSKKKSSYYLDQISKAYANGDMNKAKQILDEMNSEGLEPNENSIMRKVEAIRNPETANFRNAPKSIRDEVFKLNSLYSY
jgi:pentatricopeptide repeat protein